MLNKSIANNNKSKRNLLCIILGFFAVALILAIIVCNNNYYQIIRDEQYFIDGHYESLKYGRDKTGTTQRTVPCVASPVLPV